MRLRLLAAGAAAWVVAYLCGYLLLIREQHDSGTAWWYVAVVGSTTLVLIAVAAGRAGRRALIFALTVLGLCAFIAVLSIGFLLVPAIIAIAIAVITKPPRVQT